MKKFNYVIMFGLSFLGSLLFAMLRKSNIHPLSGGAISSIVGFTVIFFITLFALKKYSELNRLLILLSIWLGVSILEIPARIILEDTIGSLPSYVYWCLGIVFGYAFWKSGSIPLKFIIVIIGLIFVSFSQVVSQYWWSLFH